MQYHKLGIHSDKIWADSTTKSALKYLKIFPTDLSNQLKCLGFKKNVIGCP